MSGFVEGFVERELKQIVLRLSDEGSISAEERSRLEVASQALHWSLDPQGFKSPLAMIEGTLEATEDCSGNPRPLSS